MTNDGGMFLSYSTNDKALAGQLGDGLRAFGFDVFLAHENLVPSDEWLKEIKLHLQSCEVFVPLISESFRGSLWTDQEAGWALSRDSACLILSLLVPPVSLPHGFLGSFQALNLRTDDIARTCYKVNEAVEEKLGISVARQERAVETFVTSRSFASARENARALARFKVFSTEEVNRILTAATSNNQIYNSHWIEGPLSSIYSRYGHLATPDIRAAFNRSSGNE